jgi:hypothetical protein
MVSDGTTLVSNTLAQAGIQAYDATIVVDADIGVSVAPISNPNLLGIPTVPTAGNANNTTQVASTAFVQQEINAIPVVDASISQAQLFAYINY